MIKIKSPVTWIGNKTSILHILYALFPIGCDRYVEPFGGSGAVLLGKPVPDKFEVFNDYNHNLVNLFRCMRDRPMEFIRELGFLSLNSRDDFAVLKKFFEKEEFTEDYLKAQLDLTEILLPEVTAKEVRTLYSAARNDHDLRRAAMFLKLIRYSYSSGCKSFACQPFSLRTLFALVQDFAKRCENVVIENQDFETLIKHYDRPTTFTYCDPPYFTSEYVYDCGFTWEDHLRLYHALAGMKGKFLLSYNDCPEIRELYKEYNFFDFKRVHSMAQKYEAGKEFPELLIANYDLFERERQQPHQLTLFDSIDKPLDYEKNIKGEHCMQNKKMKTEIIMLPVPAELFLEAGMFEGDPLQMYADGHKIAIENIDNPKDIVCDGDCENRPIADIDCDGDCEDCPCSDNCDESEAN